jgi:ABC-2 type transport system ATP-binding protein
VEAPVEKKVALKAEGLSVGYGERNVLSGLDLEVLAGEVFALLGGNGAGKSTLLNVFLGFLKPRSGSVWVGDVEVARDPEAARRQLAYVAESVALYDHLSALENLDYLLALAEVPRLDQDLTTVLASVGIDAATAKQRVASYSKGMRQRVAIALALARGAPVLLLDEPTSGLDPQGVEEFGRLLGTLRERRKTVLLVTHDLLGAIESADRIGFLRDGRLADEFHASADVLADVAAARKRYALKETA